MLQRLIAIVLSVLGLASIALGVASATAWRAQDTLVATTSAMPTGAGTLLVTAPGVLELGGAPVTVTARANGGTKVVLAIGREADVAGWVGTDPHAVIAGLSARSTLRSDAAEAEPPAEPTPVPREAPADAAAPADPAAAAAPDPDGSDLWVTQAVGARSAELTWTPQAGRWTLLVAGGGEGAKAPVVVLSWPQTVTTPWLVPGVAVGAVLLALGIALGVRLWIRARRSEQALWHAVETGAIPIVVGSSPTSGGAGPGTAGSASGGRGSAGPGSPGLGGTATGAPGSAQAGSTGLAPADDAPTIVLTRRQMREAAATAPTPRVSLRRRAPHAPGDLSPAKPSEPAAGASSAGGSSSVAPTTEPEPRSGVDPGAPDSRRARRPDRTWRLGARGSAPGSSPTAGTTAPTASTTTPTVAGSPGAAVPWVPGRPADPAASSSPATPPGGSRADAWRRSWGITGGDSTGSAAGSAATAARVLPAVPALPADLPENDGPIDPDSTRSGKDD